MTPADIHAARKQLGMNQTEFATATGLSRQASVSDLERGLYPPCKTLALLIAALVRENRSHP